MCSLQCTLHSVQCTFCSMYSVKFIVCSRQCADGNVQEAVCRWQCAVGSVQWSVSSGLCRENSTIMMPFSPILNHLKFFYELGQGILIWKICVFLYQKVFILLVLSLLPSRCKLSTCNISQHHSIVKVLDKFWKLIVYKL